MTFRRASNWGHRRSPKPPLAYRVGVVGHRSPRLQNADRDVLKARIDEILKTVVKAIDDFKIQHTDEYAADEARLRVISSLADGADQIFAQAAWEQEREFELVCVMPFTKSEFEKDFTVEKQSSPDAYDCFHRLLAAFREKSRLTVFELRGERSCETHSYRAAGHIVLSQSDLLVVVWDGYRHNKPGGTEEMLDEARRQGLPVIWIDAEAPHHWQVVNPDDVLPYSDLTTRIGPVRNSDTILVKRIVQEQITLPASDRQFKDLNQFYREKGAISLAIGWRMFRMLGKSRKHEHGFRRASTAPRRDPSSHSSEVEKKTHEAQRLFLRTDRLAVANSNNYRSTFVAAYILAALAVGFALLPILFGEPSKAHSHSSPIADAPRESADGPSFTAKSEGADSARFKAKSRIMSFSYAELLLIAMIGISVMLGRKFRWHERWIDYRLAAEFLRHLQLVVPLGARLPLLRLPAHLATYGAPATTWMAWYVRALERYLGLPAVEVSRSHLKICTTRLIELIHSQLDFHRSNECFSHRIERRLHRLGLAALWATAIACGIHILSKHMSDASGFGEFVTQHEGVLTVLCGFLPALGAAFAGINNQGEFTRISKRSRAMASQLDRLLTSAISLLEELDICVEIGCHLMERVSKVTTDTTSLMLNEVLDWRVVFLDRPLTPPS